MTKWEQFDFSKTEFRASSWGNLMTEPKEKSAQARGDLSSSCKSELVKIYAQEVYGRKKDITSKHMRKGLMCEDDGIKLYSEVDKIILIKNDVEFHDGTFKGTPDLLLSVLVPYLRPLQGSRPEIQQVDDIKCSWDLETFLAHMDDKVDREYNCQMNVYYALTGAKRGNLVYPLVSAPDGLVADEQRRLLFNMNVATEADPEFVKLAEKVKHNMVFEDIDPKERLIKIPVKRDDDLIAQMRAKAPLLREWLHDFHQRRRLMAT